jgi:hypothetical protein
MHTDVIPATNGGGYATRQVTKPPEWHGLVVWDMLFNNLTTGLFLVMALGELAAPAVFTPLAKPAYFLAFGLLLADQLCLVLDLGDPWRFHHMLRVIKPSSPMSFGVWSLNGYAFFLTVIVAVHLLPEDWVALEWLRKVALVLGLVPAFTSSIYKGVLFSTSAQPGWRDARWLGGYLTSAAFVLGGATLLGLSIVMGQERAALILRPVVVAFLVLNLVPLALLIANVRMTLAQCYTPGRLRLIAFLSLGGGVVLPLGLLLAGGSVRMLGALVLLLLGNLLIRFVIVQVPQSSA